MIEVFSFGGGVQSVACLVLASQGKIPYSTFLFANTGDDSENPATLTYTREVSIPYAHAHGLSLIELQKVSRDPRSNTLYGRITRGDKRGIGIPVRMGDTGAPAMRACTVDFKIKVLDKWVQEHIMRGYQERYWSRFLRGHPNEVFCKTGLGISLDEFERIRTSDVAWKVLDYPLIDLRITREQCIEIIRTAGLPIPPKSACWFCPYHTIEVWADMRRNDALQFHKAVEFERFLNDRRTKNGQPPVWLTRKLVPLDQAVELPDEDGVQDQCISGHCFI